MLRVGKDRQGLGLTDGQGNLRALFEVNKAEVELSLADEKGKEIWGAP